jgi:hypothetical protein
MILITQRRKGRKDAKRLRAPQAQVIFALPRDHGHGFAAGATSSRLPSFAPLRANRISEISA